MCRNKDVLAGVVYLTRSNKFTFAKSVFNHPGRERTIVKILKSAIPATPPLKGGEIYLIVIQIITVVFSIKISLNLKAMD